MLVQLSPWQTATTSVPVATARRRRKRSSSNASDSHHHHDDSRTPPFVASFVASSNRRSSKKNKTSSSSGIHAGEKIVPLLAITSAHRVSVVGRLTSPPTNSSKDESSTPGAFLEESSQWQYVSRPGRSTSFFQESLVNGKSSKHHRGVPAIPAIVDARNDRVYALQNENGTLCSWRASQASGPDDDNNSNDSVTKVILSKPALSLSFLSIKKGIVYGACMDGTLFVGRWVHDTEDHRKETLRVEYLGNTAHFKGEQHVCTVAAKMTETTRHAGQKRKASHERDSGITIYQLVSCGEGRFRLWRHELVLPPDSTAKQGHKLEDCNHRVQSAIIYLLPCNQGEMDGRSVDGVSIMASQMDDSAMALVYRLQAQQDHSQHYYCAPISMETGQLMRSPFKLPPSTKQVGALTPSILAVATNDHILFFDVIHGAVVHSLPLTDVIQDNSAQEWTLMTDRKTGRLVILSRDNGHVKVSMATASLDGSAYRLPMERGGYNLATGLRSALATPQFKERKQTGPTTRNLVEIGSSSSVGNDTEAQHCANSCDLTEVVDRALDGLKVWRDQILDCSKQDVGPGFFLEEYERAIFSVLSVAATQTRAMETESKDPLKGVPPASVSPKKDVADNPQDAIRSSKGRVLNGNRPVLQKERNAENGRTLFDTDKPTHGKNGCLGVKLLNGISSELTRVVRGYTPSSTPQRFIDGATSIVLSTLQLPRVDDKVLGRRVQFARLDARLILSRLIQTGKVSARLHFESGPSVLDSFDDNDDQANQDNYFFSVLRAVKMTNKMGRRVFSPVDMMHEMLTCCTDLSERMMVTMIHYMLCRALPDDVAENFVDSRSLRHPDRLLSKRYFGLRTRLVRLVSENETKENSPDIENQIQKLQAELDSLSNKLLKAGVVFLVRRVVAHSRCNETLLRGALLDGLPMEHEPMLLLRILADLLTSSGRDVVSAGDTRHRRTSSVAITQWIAALCDAYRDRLQVSSPVAGENPIEHVRRAVNATLEQTEAVIALRDAFEHSTEAINSQSLRGNERTDSKKAHAMTSDKSNAGHVPPYCIESLVF